MNALDRAEAALCEMRRERDQAFGALDSVSQRLRLCRGDLETVRSELLRLRDRALCPDCGGEGELVAPWGAPAEDRYQEANSEECSRCHGTGVRCVSPRCDHHD